jgi:hypothetical protein
MTRQMSLMQVKLPRRSTLRLAKVSLAVVAGHCALFAIATVAIAAESSKKFSLRDIAVVFGVIVLLLLIVCVAGWAYWRLDRACWSLARNGVVVSGLRASRVHYLARIGDLAPTDHLWRDGLTGWVAAAQVPGLFRDRELLEFARNKKRNSDSDGVSSRAGRGSLAYTLGTFLGIPFIQRLIFFGLIPLALLLVFVKVWGGSGQVSGSVTPRLESFVPPPASREVNEIQADIDRARFRSPADHVSGAETYLRRAYDEEKLAARARFDAALDDARKHEQRAADYRMAARFYLQRGHEPPGFDADLATK